MPLEIPVTIPVVEPTVAIELALLDHSPPDTELLKVVVAPMQTSVVPVIAAGASFTVIDIVPEQPLE